jgi:hypothetical protein
MTDKRHLVNIQYAKKSENRHKTSRESGIGLHMRSTYCAATKSKVSKDIPVKGRGVP